MFKYYLSAFIATLALLFVLFSNGGSHNYASASTINPLLNLSPIASPSATITPQVLQFMLFPTTNIVPTKVSPTPIPTPTSIDYCLNVPVLFYHHIQPDIVAKAHGNDKLSVDNSIFETQMKYLFDQGYTTLTASDLMNALINHTELPAKSILITLDDGYLDNYTYAYPIFQKYQQTAHIMLSTGLIGGADYLSWEQVEEMSRSGLIHYTDHTWSHYPLNQGDNSKVQFEVMSAKQQIESHIGEKVNILTYPYGAFSDNVINVLKQNEFIGAFTTLPGSLQCESNIMKLPRIRVGNLSLSSYGL